MTTSRTAKFVVGLIMSVSAQLTQAAPVNVSFTTSGSSGDWYYDFSVNNDIGFNQKVYFFGVKTAATGIVGSPTGWTYSPENNPWNNIPWGGAVDGYNNPWLSDGSTISFGETVSGFQVHDTSTSALTSINWFAFAIGDNYPNANINPGWNPGFEGVAGLTAPIPEPETYAMMLAGLGLLGVVGRRRKQSQPA